MACKIREGVDHLVPVSSPCVQKFPPLPPETTQSSKVQSAWQRAVDWLSIGSEASNIGIVFVVLTNLIPPLLAVGKEFISTISFLTDPAIYCFKALIRVVRLIGREGFGFVFEEELHGKHEWQTLGDATTLALFSLAIPLFLGVIISGPVGITTAWAVALIGLGIVGFFDYYHPAKLAEEHLQTLDPSLPPEARADLEKDCTSRKNSARLFGALLIGLTLLLISGSAAAFAPPLLIPILLMISKIASVYLTCIAVARFSNFVWTNYHK
jgi:hypothetical protein